jgi:hypothetical protein
MTWQKFGAGGFGNERFLARLDLNHPAYHLPKKDVVQLLLKPRLTPLIDFGRA